MHSWWIRGTHYWRGTQQTVYNNTFATIKRQLLQVENPTPAVVISVDAAPVDNRLHLDYLTSEVVLEEPEIGSTDPNNPIDNNWMNDELHFGMPGGRGITKMKVMKAKCAMPTPPPAGDDGPWLNSRGLSWEPVMSTGVRARMAMIHMRMRKKQNRKPMMDQHRMRRPDGRVDSTWEPVISMGMSARMATMRMRMRRTKHRKPMMDQRTMWRTKRIVLESVKIRLYISDM